MAESSKTEKRKRVEKVRILFLRGYTRQELLTWVRDESGWDIEESTAEKYIASARTLIKAPENIDIDAAWGEAHDRIKGMIKDCTTMHEDAKTAGDLRGQEAAIGLKIKLEADLSRLLGLNRQQPKQQHINVVNVDLPSLPSEEFSKEILRRMAEAEYHMKMLDVPHDEEQDDDNNNAGH